MDAETLEALRGSIQKWEAIVAGTGKDSGASNCPLCKLFNKQEINEEYGGDTDIRACDGCPVQRATGADWCEASPYERFVSARHNLLMLPKEATADIEVSMKEMAVHAQAELDFLKSLLPSPDKSMEQV